MDSRELAQEPLPFRLARRVLRVRERLVAAAECAVFDLVDAGAGDRPLVTDCPLGDRAVQAER